MTIAFRLLLASLVMVALAAPRSAHAHALQPGYLEVTQISPGLFGVLWRLPIVGGGPMPIQAVLPETCEQRRAMDLIADGAGYTGRWTTHCTEGLGGGTVAVAGLERTRTDVLVRIDHGGGVVETHRLTPLETSAALSGRPTWQEVSGTYFLLGVDHILAGIDHLLFVLALTLLIGFRWRLLEAITAFTIAHSITLALAALGHLSLPPPPVEAMIALSIVFLATELAKGTRSNRLSARYPWVVAFPFGLIHGLGFAGALEEIGLPQTEVPPALLAFNLGVEAGQLLFVAVVVSIVAISSRMAGRGHAAMRLATSYAIGTVASYWLIERVYGFW